MRPPVTAHPAAFSVPSARPAPLGVLADAGLLVAVLVAASDMLVQLGPVQSLVWMGCYALALLRIAACWGALLPVLLASGALLAYPAVCLASVLWSAARGESLSSAIQLSMSVLIAVYLGWRYSPRLLLKALAVVLSAGVALSLLHWATGVFPWPVYTEAGGLAGLFSHKNMLGQRALFVVVAVLAVWLMRRGEAGPVFRTLSVAAMAGSLAALALAQSMTSVVLVPVLVALLLALCLRRLPGGARLGLVAVAVLGVALGPVLLAVWNVDPVGAVLGSTGKSTTLTGRTDIWEIAAGVWREHPILGAGYRAFWSAPQFLTERIMTQEAGARTSASFHNFVLEVGVGTGVPGLLAMLLLIWAAAARLWRLFARTGAVAAAAGLVLVFGIVVTSLVGTSLYRGHELALMLLVMLAVSAREELRGAGARPRDGARDGARDDGA